MICQVKVHSKKAHSSTHCIVFAFSMIRTRRWRKFQKYDTYSYAVNLFVFAKHAQFQKLRVLHFFAFSASFCNFLNFGGHPKNAKNAQFQNVHFLRMFFFNCNFARIFCIFVCVHFLHLYVVAFFLHFLIALFLFFCIFSIS